VSYAIQILPRAERQLAALEARIYATIKSKIAGLADDPRPPGCRKLKDHSGWRVRDGNYRILYDIDDRDTSSGNSGSRPPARSVPVNSFLFPALYFRRQFPFVKLNGNRVAECDDRGVAEDGSGGVGYDGVAAFEDFQGAAFFELDEEFSEAFAFDSREAFHSFGKFSGSPFESNS